MKVVANGYVFIDWRGLALVSLLVFLPKVLPKTLYGEHVNKGDYVSLRCLPCVSCGLPTSSSCSELLAGYHST